MDREFLDRLSPPRPRRKPMSPAQLDEKLKKDLEKSRSYFEWDNDDLNQASQSGEEISFKPINSGLGFHPNKNSLPSLETHFRSKKENDLWEKPKYFSFEEAKKKSFEDTSLSPFYEPEHEKKLEKIFAKDQIIQEKVNFEVRIWQKFFSWSVDAIIVMALTAINLWLMFTLADLNLSFSNFDVENMLLTSSLFGFWYLIYFTLGDFLGATFGKRLFGLEVKTKERRNIDFSQAILRSFFSLISLATCGIFSIFDGPSVGSQTQVYNRGR